jgi:hypothetical protein
VDFDELVDRKTGFAAYLEERRSSGNINIGRRNKEK